VAPVLADLLRDRGPALLDRWRHLVTESGRAVSPELAESMRWVLESLEAELRFGDERASGGAVEIDLPSFGFDALMAAIVEAADARGYTLTNAESQRLLRFALARTTGAAPRLRARTTSVNTQLVAAHGRVDELTSLARSSQAQLQLVIDALPVLISFVTPDERYGLVNQAYEDWFGVSKESVIGCRLVEVVGEAAYERLRPQVLRALAGERFSFEQRAVPYPRGKRDIRATFVPQRDDDGRVTGYVALLEDISSRLQLEAEREAMAQERSSVLAKQAAFERQLIGIVSHDLRNPLNVVSLGTQVLLESGELSPETAKHALRVSAAAERASRLVGDLLDFTQARHGGGLAIVRAACDLGAVIQTVIEDAQTTYPERRIELQQTGPSVESVGMWDADRIAQVVQNLITNAVKYSSPASTITVSVGEQATAVVLSVHNVGVAIPAEKLPILFEPYERAGAQASSAHGSVGLGLHIVKLVVEAHGGTVDVESTPDAGTTFRVALPRTVGELT